MSILQTIDLKKYYGTEPNITKALDGVNFSVEEGEFVAVVGTSGSGKSTMLHICLLYTSITLISGYIIDRERTDDTLKNIITIPISFRKLLVGKLITVGCMAIALSVIEFLFTMVVFLSLIHI